MKYISNQFRKPKTSIYSNIEFYYHPLRRRTVLISVGFSNIPSQSLGSVASNTGSTSHRDIVYISVRSKSFRPNTRLCRSHKTNVQSTAQRTQTHKTLLLLSRMIRIPNRIVYYILSLIIKRNKTITTSILYSVCGTYTGFDF